MSELLETEARTFDASKVVQVEKVRKDPVFAIIGFLVPLIGLILYLGYKNSDKVKRISAAWGALLNIVIDLGLLIIALIVILIRIVM